MNATTFSQTIKLYRSMITLAAILLIALSASAQKTLTNDSIIRMSKEHLSSDVILNAIRTTPGQYSLDTDDLINLKKAGVPDIVVVAMQKAAGGRVASPAPALKQEAEPAPSPNGATENWTLQQVGDQMSGERYEIAKTTITGQHGGALAVVAQCNNDLALSLYMASLTPGLTFQRSPMSQTVVVNRGAFGTATGVAGPPRYCADFRVRAGSGSLGLMTSQLCDNDTTAEIIFPGDPAKLMRANASMLGSLMPSTPPDATHKDGPDIGSMLTDLMANLATGIASPIDAFSGTIRMAEVVKADSLALELPFAGGQKPIILLHPQTPVLKSYLAKCMSVSPVPDKPNTLSVAPPTKVPDPARFGPGHSITDSYARSLEIVKLNESKGIADPIDLWSSMYARNVCFSISGTKLPNGNVKRSCDKTGELVRTPGDLAESPRFWKDVPNLCKAAGFDGLEVKLNPSPSDGKKRFLGCTDLFVLSAQRDQMIEEGLR